MCLEVTETISEAVAKIGTMGFGLVSRGGDRLFEFDGHVFLTFFPNLAFNIIDFSKTIGCFVMITLLNLFFSLIDVGFMIVSCLFNHRLILIHVVSSPFQQKL